MVDRLVKVELAQVRDLPKSAPMPTAPTAGRPELGMHEPDSTAGRHQPGSKQAVQPDVWRSLPQSGGIRARWYLIWYWFAGPLCRRTGACPPVRPILAGRLFANLPLRSVTPARRVRTDVLVLHN